MSLDIEKHRKKMVERDLEKEFKDDNNPFRLVIVCSMWITGFDVPSVSTMYLDKPLKGHTLMQTIARANRVYDEEKKTKSPGPPVPWTKRRKRRRGARQGCT